ncbi:MAG TPA: phosphotransferase [Ktedonobacterales bacterium]
MDVEALRCAWPQTGAWLGEPAPLKRGTNNLMYRVETAIGVYALRVSGAQVDERRLSFECDILAQLGAAGLPFALPMPLITASGARWLRLENEGDVAGPALATLTALIAGAHPQRDDLAQAAGAGEALGLLDEALAALRLDQPALGIDWRSTGDLTRCHPLVPDPPAAIGALPLSAEETHRLIANYEALIAASAPLYASLPRQLSHEDFDPGNILMLGERVSGVLDWEFCAVDLRAMDLVVALTWWPVERFGSGDEWPILAALARGYGRARTLDHAEVATIPTLFLLRAYTSLIHRLGRWRAGLSPLEHVLWRAQAALERDDWLRANGERLIQLVDEALHVRADGASG